MKRPYFGWLVVQNRDFSAQNSTSSLQHGSGRHRRPLRRRVQVVGPRPPVGHVFFLLCFLIRCFFASQLQVFVALHNNKTYLRLQDVLKEAMASEECAQTWLPRNGFAWKPKMCDSCNGKDFYNCLHEQEGRSAHWRCTKREQRTLFLTLSFFCGFRCSCMHLLDLFRAYVKDDFAESP